LGWFELYHAIFKNIHLCAGLIQIFFKNQFYRPCRMEKRLRHFLKLPVVIGHTQKIRFFWLASARLFFLWKNRRWKFLSQVKLFSLGFSWFFLIFCTSHKEKWTWDNFWLHCNQTIKTYIGGQRSIHSKDLHVFTCNM